MANKEQARKTIAGLIERYEGLGDRGRKALNEANTRKDFILPLFAALGWKTDDSSEVAEEVRVGKDWADYAFKVGGITRFYLEAKAADVDLEKDQWAHQAVSYAYNKGISWAVLTNFEGLKLFSAEWDVKEVARLRVLDLSHTQYVEHFDDLWALSKASVKDDGLRKRFEARGGAVRKRMKVDERLFSLLKEWRLKLIQLFVQYQPPDSPLMLGQIDEAVQRILDRLIFVRTVEDRLIENPILSPIQHRRTGAKASGADAWTSLREEFRRLDRVYNSNLFAEHLADSLKADESVFLPMLAQLYTPDGSAFRFDFSAIEADVLGRVYEQYLGHVIETTKSPVTVGGKVYLPGMQPANAEMVDVVAKQAKRKQQGIYYTPKYIVDYIVEQTLGRLLDEQGGDAAFVEQITVLDPACGSGSFLIAAYERLLRYYAEVKQVAPEHLDQDERVEILLRHIYGVDLDPQAVEIARLNLLLRALREPKLLPEMDGNIVRGNSLIGEISANGDGAQTGGAHTGAPLPDNALVLNWHERFPEVMARGGFGVVIGNPPYVRQETLGVFKDYLQENYAVYHGMADLSTYFIERSMSLLESGGRFGMIVPNKWMRANYGEPLRQWLKGQGIEEIIDFGDLPVFQDAITYPCILTAQKDSPAEVVSVTQVQSLDFVNLAEYAAQNRYSVEVAQLGDKGWSLAGEQTGALLEKLRAAGVPLGVYVEDKIYYGIKTGLNEAFVIDEQTRNELIKADPNSAELIKPFLMGRDVKRYETPQVARYLIFTRRGVDINRYPVLKQYLSQFKDRLMPKPDDWVGAWNGRKPGNYEWFEVQDPIDYHEEFEKPKIIVPAIVQRATYSFDTQGRFSNDKTTIIPTTDLYLLGLLNSRVPDFVMHSISSTKQGGFFEYKPMYLEQLPIRQIDFTNPNEVALHDRVVQHVEALLELHRQRAAMTPSTDAWDELDRQIADHDRAVDGIVYQLYGLTEEEIGIVEGA